MLSRASRILLALAALSLCLGFVAPLWRISLRAPQYPEGLGMVIWADRITGDLRSINGLNHYIGMAAIEPESIPELRLMRPLLAVLLGAGLLAAGLGRRSGLLAWTAALLLLAAVGLADFWWWGYRYGHNLSADAAIRIPGMSYQPPLLGSKQLLNFEAVSWPAAAGWAVSAAVLVAVALSVTEWRRVRSAR